MALLILNGINEETTLCIGLVTAHETVVDPLHICRILSVST